MNLAFILVAANSGSPQNERCNTMSGNKTPKSWDNMGALPETDSEVVNESPFDVRNFAGKTCEYPVAHIDTIKSLDDLEALARFLQDYANARFPDIPDTAVEGFTLEKIIEEGIKRVGSVIVMDPTKWPKGRDEAFATFEKEMTKAFNARDIARRDELKELHPEQWEKFVAKRAKEQAALEAKNAFIS